MATKIEPGLKDELVQLLDDFVVTLDSRRPHDWLGLFTEDGYYSVLRYSEFAKGNNTLIMGEDIGRLRARIDMGLSLDTRRQRHLLTAPRIIETTPELRAEVSFGLWYDGVATFAGAYHLVLERVGGALRIKRCETVIDNIIITDTVYLPI